MSELRLKLNDLDKDSSKTKSEITESIQAAINASGYEIVEMNDEKPWGLYFCLNRDQADSFVEDFFPEMNATEARLGNPDAELSPKFLVVSPEQRLSWQYHNRRAERWVFLTEGRYNKSLTDEPGEVVEVVANTIVQFDKGERHRLVGLTDGYVIVAEIWQHIDPANPSDEDDIVRLADDYSR
jgi:mannose-6-phosphate isomerase